MSLKLNRLLYQLNSTVRDNMKQLILGFIFIALGGGILGWVDLRITVGVDLVIVGAFLIYTSNN